MVKFLSFMSVRLLSIFVALLIAVCANSVFSQNQLTGFLSIYGNFRIELPANPSLTRGVRNADAPDKGAGMIYAWNGPDVVYTALYLDPIDGPTSPPTPAEKALALEENNKGVRDTVAKYKGEITAEKPIVIGSLEGTEIRAKIGSGQLIVRNFQVGRRSYSIQAVISEPDSVAKALTAISSFRIVDGSAMLKTMVERLTPPPFTEKPKKSKRKKTDLELSGLKGQVASVTEYTEDLTGDDFQQGPILAASFTFDAAGFQTTEMNANPRGLPVRVIAYGFHRGTLAARVGRFDKSDRNAIDLKIVNVFDDAGRITETRYTDLKGKLKSVTRFAYSNKTVEVSVVDDKGTVQARKRQIFDDRGNVVETIVLPANSDVPEDRSVFTYDSFDEFGNWTKRTEFELRTEKGVQFKVPSQVTYRTYVYYRK